MRCDTEEDRVFHLVVYSFGLALRDVNNHFICSSKLKGDEEEESDDDATTTTKK